MRKIYLISILAMTILSACFKSEKSANKTSFNNRNIKVNSDIMTPEVLWSFGQLGNVAVSPDGKMVAYTVSYANIEENRSYSDVYIIPVKGGSPIQITKTNYNESQVGWRPDGKKISFLAKVDEDIQLWEMNIDGSHRKQISNIEGGISGYKYSPDMTKIVFYKSVKLDKTVNDIYPDLPKANARIENDLMYRHWDQWHNYEYNHVFIADYKTNKPFEKAIDIMEDEKFHSPTQPFGGIEQITWTPDGKGIVYTSKKLSGKEAAFSTNSDLYFYDIENKTTVNLTQGMMGYDMNPIFSEDGKMLAFESMERDGYEADKVRLMVMNWESKQITDYTKDFDHNISNITWDKKSGHIWFSSSIEGTEQIYLLGLENGEINKITSGRHNLAVAHHTGEELIAVHTTISSPREIYKIELQNGETSNLSQINKPLLDQLTMGNVEKRWIRTTDDKKMLVWVIYPPHFDRNKKYPTLLYCQGGPQSAIDHSWSTRWNFQMMAANEYIIVAPNRRGLPGFGTEWNEQISGDYGGQNMKDYLSAIDALSKEPFVDTDKLGAIGASYGGFSVNWLAGNHEKRFKAFISHCGIFNLDMMYTTTEEMFFVDWDLKGPYWGKPNKTYEYSPHRFVDKWDTPIMIIHGEKDFRIPYTQGMAAFNAARMRGIPAKFLFYPEENHWVLTPQNGILWQREFFDWLDRWLK